MAEVEGELVLDGARAAYRGAHCRKCGASVLWVETANGARQALDVRPTGDGTVELRRSVSGLVAVAHSEPPEEGHSRYRVHVASCTPRIRGWRGRR